MTFFKPRVKIFQTMCEDIVGNEYKFEGVSAGYD